MHIALNPQLATPPKLKESHLNRPYIILEIQRYKAQGSKINSLVSKITSLKCYVGTMPKVK